MKNSLFLVSIIFLLTGCNHKKQTNLTSTDAKSISFTASPVEVKFSEIYNSDFGIVRLETTKESVFAIPTKTRFTENYIFIFDQTKKIFLIFNRDGTFRKKLDKLGKGPGEYISIADFTLSDKKKIIYIYDDIQRKIISYDFDMKFISEKVIPFYFQTFECLNNDNFVFYTLLKAAQQTNFRYDIIITDGELKIQDKFFPYPFTNAGRGHDDKLLKVNNSDTICFYTNYSNMIYEIIDGNIQPKYKINDFNKYELPPDDFYLEREKEGKQNGKVADDIMESPYIYSYMFYENNHKIMLFFSAKKNGYVSFLNTKTQEQWHTSKLVDDFDLFLDFKYYKPRFFYKDKLGYFIFPYLALEDLDKHPAKRINPKISDMQLSENPIIVLFTLK